MPFQKEPEMLQMFLGKPGSKEHIVLLPPGMFLTSMFATREEPKRNESNLALIPEGRRSP